MQSTAADSSHLSVCVIMKICVKSRVISVHENTLVCGFVELLHGERNMERLSFSVPFSAKFWFHLLILWLQCLSGVFFSSSSLFFFAYDSSAVLRLKLKFLLKKNGDYSCSLSRAARGLFLQSLRAVDRWAEFPLEDSWLNPGVKAESWVAPRKALVHGLGHKISRRMLIAEDKRIHINTCHGFVCMHTVISPVVWSVLIYGCGGQRSLSLSVQCCCNA